MADWMFREQSRIDSENEKWLEQRPICSICEEHIQEEYAYEVEGKLICPTCLEEFRIDLD